MVTYTQQELVQEQQQHHVSLLLPLRVSYCSRFLNTFPVNNSWVVVHVLYCSTPVHMHI